MRSEKIVAVAALLLAAGCMDESTPLEPEQIADASTLSTPVMSAQAPLPGGRHLHIDVTAFRSDTGKPLGSSVPPGTVFQVKVATNGVDCAGQFVVTALGAPGAPPSVLVQVVPFITGPALGQNAAIGAPLTAAGPGNAFKISASCNGARDGEHSFGFTDFKVVP